eukprot:592638_1
MYNRWTGDNGFASFDPILLFMMTLLIVSSFIPQINAQNNASYFECEGYEECADDMYCIDGQDCTVLCTGSYSCTDGAIHPPNVGNLTVICGLRGQNSHHACNGMTLRAPNNGSFTLLCAGITYGICLGVEVICPMFGECIVDFDSFGSTSVDASNMASNGLYLDGIRYGTVKCPGNYLDCVINCTASRCDGTSVYTKNDSILSIFASGASSLQNADVHCAPFADCSIIVTQPVSDALSHFKLYSIDGANKFICDYARNVSECYDFDDPPQLWCGSQYDTGCAMTVNMANNKSLECQNMTVTELCASNETLSGYYASQIVCIDYCDYDMYCIDGQDCTVLCTGSYSCTDGAIHPPNVGNLTVICGLRGQNSHHACNGMTLRAPNNGSFTLLCAGITYGICLGVEVICPMFGECIVDFDSFGSTSVDASNMASNGLYLDGIRYGTVKCPGNYLDCVINCTASRCDGTSVYTKNDSILSIFASGASSLQNADVHCAPFADCSIIVTQPVSDALSHFKLYSIDGANKFICDYARNVSECYDFDDPPQLWCGSQYDTGCAMVNKGNNSWDCQNMTVSELCTSNETLGGYYGSQIVCSKQGECNSVDLYCIDGEYCAVTCSASGSCGGATIHPPNVGNLSVTCGPSEHSCRDLILKRPMNGSFTLSCAGHGSCFNVDAICPVFGDCTVEVNKDPPQLWCGSQYDTGCAMVNKGNNSWDCQNMTVSELCTSNETLGGYYGSQIVCSKQGECNSVDLYCIDGEYCAVTCSASGSCGGATIHPPNVGNLSVTCGPSEHSCRDLILKRPMNGSFTLSCAGHGSCFNVDAICPVFGDCTVEVTYFHHTNPVTVDATHMTYGKLQVIELQSGTVHCPGNYLECVADCIAVPCTGTSFHTKNGSILTILSSGISSLQSVNIYCALNANCSITVDCGAQRSVVCDIESNTGPSYNEWRCNVPDSSHSINFTDLCVTADPTTNPSADPIIKPTADPTAVLYDTKLNTGTETSITITCGGSDCHFDEETAKVITNILIAYLDEDVQIIGTTITSNKVIIAIANADWDSLERDTISRDIKNELEDVDVSFDDAEDDEEIEHIKPNSDIFGDILEFLTSNIILGIIIGLALFLIIMAVGCVCWLLKKRKRAKIHQNMMTIPGVNVTDADIVPGATTQAKMHHLNMMEMPGTTTQADTVTPPIVPPLPPPTTRDYDEESINDKDTDDEADELYDVVFEDTKGGNTKDGNTKGGNTKGAITAM